MQEHVAIRRILKRYTVESRFVTGKTSLHVHGHHSV